MGFFDWLSSKQAPPDPERDKALRPVIQDGKYGYIDATGAIAIKPQFARAGDFSNGLAVVRPGDIAEDPATPSWVKRKCRIGYIGYDGKTAIRPQFDKAHAFFDKELAAVEKGGTNGYINRKGRLVIKLSAHSRSGQFQEGMALVAVRHDHQKGYFYRTGYIDKSGNFVIAPQFDSACGFSEGLAAVQVSHMKNSERQWGYIDKTGKMIVEPQYEAAFSFADGVGLVRSGGLYSFIDHNGDMAIDRRFNQAGSFSEGLAPFERGSKWGYISKTGETVIEPQFAEAQLFKDGLAIVTLGGKRGYIRKDGGFAIDPQFDGANDFVGELAYVKLGVSRPGTPDWIHDYKRCKFGYINRSGQYVWGPVCPYAT